MLDLNPWPQTEEEYYEAIEGIGGILFGTRHGIARGHYESTPQLEADLQKLSDTQTKLGNEICEKLDLEHPQIRPNGSRSYFDWYNKMKRRFSEKEYACLICSACPYSKGIDSFLGLDSIPCDIFTGWMGALRAPWLCGYCTVNGDEQEAIIRKIREEFGEDVAKAFEAKEKELKVAVEQDIIKSGRFWRYPNKH